LSKAAERAGSAATSASHKFFRNPVHSPWFIKSVRQLLASLAALQVPRRWSVTDYSRNYYRRRGVLDLTSLAVTRGKERKRERERENKIFNA